MFQSSTKPLQVRFRDHHGNRDPNSIVNNGNINSNITGLVSPPQQQHHQSGQHQPNQQAQQQQQQQQQVHSAAHQMPGFQQVAAAVQQQQLIRQIQPQALNNYGVNPYGMLEKDRMG